MFSVRSLHIAFELWGFVFCLIAIACVILGESMEKEKRKQFVMMQLSAGVLLLMDAFAWGFRGYPGTIGYYMVRISNFFVFFLSDELLMCYHAYVCRSLFAHQKKENLPKRVWLVYVIALIGMILVIVSQFTDLYYCFDADNYYHRRPLHPLSVLIGMISMALDFSLIVQYGKNVSKTMRFSMISYTVLPAASTVILLFYYGISFINISIGISMVFMFIATMTEQSRELAQVRIEVMLSQINPHFLYNTLGSISYMCTENPQLAAETVTEFSEFLRGNMDSLTGTNLIPFERELKHTQNYLAIEKKRFGDRLQIEWDIGNDIFMLPALTLQPIVENAVRHGVMQKEQGGTVRIRTWQDRAAFYVSVEDDGVGFDESARKKDGRQHTGIVNVQSRLKSICDGTLIIRSKKGRGTVVEMRIPMEQLR